MLPKTQGGVLHGGDQLGEGAALVDVLEAELFEGRCVHGLERQEGRDNFLGAGGGFQNAKAGATANKKP